MWYYLKTWLTFSPDIHCPPTFQFVSNLESDEMITIWRIPYFILPCNLQLSILSMMSEENGHRVNRINAVQNLNRAKWIQCIFHNREKASVARLCSLDRNVQTLALLKNKMMSPLFFPKSWYTVCKQMIVQCWPESVNHPAHCLHRSVLNPNH